jgi:hypothetical protein
VTKYAKALHVRANELEVAEYRYNLLTRSLLDFFQALGESEFGRKIDRDVIDQLGRVLEHEILPNIQAVRDEYTALFGFAWGDRVRVENEGAYPIEILPSHMNFAPYAIEPFSWLHGWKLKADGRPGKRVLIAKLVPGQTRVTVLSSE